MMAPSPWTTSVGVTLTGPEQGLCLALSRNITSSDSAGGPLCLISRGSFALFKIEIDLQESGASPESILYHWLICWVFMPCAAGALGGLR